MKEEIHNPEQPSSEQKSSGDEFSGSQKKDSLTAESSEQETSVPRRTPVSPGRISPGRISPGQIPSVSTVHIPPIHEIAAQLEALEETIIFKICDRIQFRENLGVYAPGKSGFSNAPPEASLLSLRLQHQERMDALFGRFEIPEERPFSDDLPSPQRAIRPPLSPLRLADYNQVNLTASIYTAYRDYIPLFCREGDDGQYGSSVEHDVFALQALSRRIHYGAMYVAERKYQDDAGVYQKLIDRGDKVALMDKLTRPEVEERVLRRVGEKLDYIQEIANREVRFILEKSVLIEFYREVVIPLTKEGEVRYLLNRQ